MSTHALAYADARARISDLVKGLDDEGRAKEVTACPGWSVKDALAHIVGIARDMMEGNLANVGEDEWTAAHVEAGRARTAEELLQEWSETGPQVEKALEVIHPAMAGMTLADLITHEHDMRTAVGDRSARDTDGVALSLESYARYCLRRLREAGKPPLAISGGQAQWASKEGDPVATVSGEPFEVFRALAGRRTLDEVRALDWTGDSEAFISSLSNYGYPERSLGE